jgi:hypothetical protein
MGAGVFIILKRKRQIFSYLNKKFLKLKKRSNDEGEMFQLRERENF